MFLCYFFSKWLTASDNDFYRQFFDSDNVSDESFHGFKLETLPADEPDIDLDILVMNQKLLVDY